jgi:hypothetical protein
MGVPVMLLGLLWSRYIMTGACGGTRLTLRWLEGKEREKGGTRVPISLSRAFLYMTGRLPTRLHLLKVLLYPLPMVHQIGTKPLPHRPLGALIKIIAGMQSAFLPEICASSSGSKSSPALHSHLNLTIVARM